jgi:hypothetical protein
MAEELVADHCPVDGARPEELWRARRLSGSIKH